MSGFKCIAKHTIDYNGRSYRNTITPKSECYGQADEQIYIPGIMQFSPVCGLNDS